MKNVRFSQIAMLGLLVAFATPAVAQQANPNPDEVFARLDNNADGKLTADELTGEGRTFFDHVVKVVDLDKNGALNKQEFFLALEYRGLILQRQGLPAGRGGPGSGRFGRPPLDPKRLFETMDRNRDGKLTLDELPEEARKRLKPLFDRLGKDALTLEDFAKLRQRFGGSPGAPGEFFKRFDANRDGKVTLQEIPAPLRQRLKPLFDRLGKDALTAEDFAKLRNRRSERPARPDNNRRPKRPE